MFSNKKGKIMRHPYVTLTIIGLATVGAMSIACKMKSFVYCKAGCIQDMMNGMKRDMQEMV